MSPPQAAAASSAASQPDALEPLRQFEAARRAATDFATLPPSSQLFGPDPYAIRALPGEARGFVGVLRGRDAIVQLDATLREVRRLPAPASPGALDVGPSGEVWVAGELSTRVARYRVGASGALEAAGEVETHARAIRGVAAGPEGVLHVVEEHDGRLLTVDLAKGAVREARPCTRGAAMRVVRTKRHVVVDCMLDHAIVAYRVDAKGAPREETASRLTNDGPLWGFDAVEAGDDLVVAAGGVEDHPLERTGGFFGYIDSFVYVARQAKGEGPFARAAAVNVSEPGVVTPKALLFEEGARAVVVAGYGADRMARIRLDSAPPEVAARPLLPGVSALARREHGFVAADPLVDAWIAIDDAGFTPSFVEDDRAPRSDDSKVGEALVFTSLMAPHDSSEGALSRFTCETCHFEQVVDGRTHHTGRGDVHATTKPLLGLFNNRPHFSRALDPDLTTVSHNEFRVAGAHSGTDPWFSVEASEFPWLAALRLEKKSFSPVDLRRAFVTYLMESTHRPNPAAVVRDQAGFTDEERAGAAAFRDRCATCHAARVLEDDASTEVPFDRWEALVLSPSGPIVWGSPEYRKTGVEPYVNDLGCRTPSLRRLYKKRPYFTNGSATDLAAVLDRVRWDEARFFHDGAPADAPLAALDARTKSALLAFLDLL